MKYVIFLFSVLASSIISFSQGIKGEIGFNDEYSQFAKDAVCEDEFAYVLISGSSYLGPIPVLRKTTIQGAVVWNKTISSTLIDWDGEETGAGLTRIHQIKNSNDGGLIFTAWATDACDYQGITSCNANKLDEDGNEVWFTRFDDSLQNIESFNSNINNSIIYSGTDYLFVKVKTFYNQGAFFELNQETGEIVHFFYNTTIHGLTNIIRINGELYGLLDQEIVKFNTDGEIMETIALPYNFVKFHFSGNKIVARTTLDELILLDLGFSEIDSYPLNDEGTILKAKILNNQFNVLLETENDFKLLIFNEESLEINSEKHFNFPEEYSQDAGELVNFNSNLLVVLAQFTLAHSSFESVRTIYYSMNDPEDEHIPWIDAEIEAIDPYDVLFIPIDQMIPNVHDLKIKAKALVKNNSNHVLNSVILNHYEGLNVACGYNVYQHEFHDLAIAPGESKWIDLGQIHNEHNYFGGAMGDSSHYNLCVYTSNPNGIVDLNVSNDMYCHKTFLGVLDLENNTLIKSTKKVIKIVNLLGQEVKPEPNKLLIFIYDDGTSEKRILTE